MLAGAARVVAMGEHDAPVVAVAAAAKEKMLRTLEKYIVMVVSVEMEG